MWYLYLIECDDGSLYTGITTDLEKRMNAHQTGKGSKYVASRGLKRLIASKEYLTRPEALKAEYFVKQLPKHQKKEWIEK
ncbi:MAG: GIY-YIG nuclease family protein [Nanoarchaeota archaeon]